MTTLGEVARFVRGVTFKPTDVTKPGEPGAIPVMRTKNVQATLDLSDVIAIPSRLVRSAEQLLQPGDILISSANSWNLVGKCCWVPDLDEPAAIGGFVTALRPDCSRVDPRYLYHWFASRRTQLIVRSLGNQTTNIANLNLTRCAKMPVPLPPLEEQRRIAAILDKTDALRADRRRSKALLDDLVRSVFVDVFGRESVRAVSPMSHLSHEREWKWVLLSDVAELATGHTPDRKRPEYWDGDVPWISLPEIRSLDGKTAWDTELKVTSDGVAHSSAVVLPAGTVCFSRTASVGFVTTLGRPMATSQDFHNWIPRDSLNSKYLMTALRISRQHLLGASDGSVHKTIYQRVAATFRVLLPPKYLQDDFANRLVKIDDLYERAVGTETASESLAQTLSIRAFAGAI